MRGLLYLLGMFLWLAIAITREGKDAHPYTPPAPDNDPAPALQPRQARD